MPQLLCIESATDALSIAICDEQQILCVQESAERYAHASRITQLIERCAAETHTPLSALDAIAVSIGPGSYTSLRVGLSTAKGLAYALDIPLITIDTLSITAAGALDMVNTDRTLIFPMIDARRMEVYGAHYDTDLHCLQPARAIIMDQYSLDNLIPEYDEIILCGNGMPKLRDLYPHSPIRFGPDHNHVRHMHHLVLHAWQQQDFADVAYVEPFYLKAPNITTPKKVL